MIKDIKEKSEIVIKFLIMDMDWDKLSELR